MVVRKDIDRKQLISLILHKHRNDNTLEILTDSPESSDFGEIGSIIKEVVKRVRHKNGLRDDETLTVEVKPTNTKKGNESENKIGIMHKFDMGASKLNSATSRYGYYCKKCKLRYKHKDNFEAHMKLHESSVEESIKKIADERAKYLEKLTIEAKKSTFCEKCNKYLTSKGAMRYHINHYHLGVKKHACDICGKCFAQKGPMKEHRRIHTGERPFMCQVCGKEFRTSGILVTHLKSHSNERPYSCPTCHKTYKYSQQVDRHIVVHTGEKKFVCEVCGKRFGRSRDMKRHNITHNGLKPFPCPICNSKFNQKIYLKQHLRGKHCLDSKAACTVVQNIAPHETKQISTVDYKDQQHIPVNKTEEASQISENVEINQTNFVNASLLL